MIDAKIKSRTRHTIPVTTAKQIARLYNLSGNELRETRLMLEILGYIKPIRPHSQTYQLLKGDIPDNLELVEREYAIRFWSYNLPQAYTDLTADLMQLTEEVKQSYTYHNWSGNLGERCEQAYQLLSKAQQILPECIDVPDHTFVAIPAYDPNLAKSETGKQRRLENLISLLQTIINEVTDLYEDKLWGDAALSITSSLICIEQSINYLRMVKIPVVFEGN